MDELDIFKKQWQKEEKNLPRLEYDQIYQMILKKSSSAVKWIFIVSLFELALGMISLFWHPTVYKELEEPMVTKILSWVITLLGVYFIYRFFINYKSISTTSSVKELLANIMKSRKTVRLWIVINMVVAGIFAMIFSVNSFAELKGGWQEFNSSAEVSDYFMVLGVSFLVTIIIVGIFLLIYLLLYGFMMRRLNRNYRELKKMEL